MHTISESTEPNSPEDDLQALASWLIMQSFRGKPGGAVFAVLKACYNISYVEALAAVLAIGRNAPLVTGDEDFKELASAGIDRLRWVGR